MREVRMSTNPDDATARLMQAERDRLFQLPDFLRDRPDDEKGILLSNRIKQYCEQYKLIDPFDADRLLRPAGYDLTVGKNYSKNGERYALNAGMEFEIEPYQVAIIETFETLNLPEFLIGRWNIRVQLAYEGLLWVGGAQVDPGFRGYLCCPIYNLSTKPVILRFGQELAMIDFVTTTPFKDGECKRFDWRNRKKLIFQNYALLSSGIEKQVKDFKADIQTARQETTDALAKSKEELRSELKDADTATKQSVGDIHRRIDTFLALVFTVVAVLFAGLGIIATSRPDERSFINPPAWIAAIALYFALRAHRPSGQDPPKQEWYSRLAVALTIAAAVLLVSLGYHAWDSRISYRDLTDAKDRASTAASAVDREKQERQTAIQNLQNQVDAKLTELQQQINRLQPAQSKAK